MNEKEQRYTRLNKEYDDLNGKINRLNDFINRIDFEEIVNDEKERGLMIDQYIAMCRYRANLKARIRILRDQIENDKIIKDWSQYKNTDSVYIGVDVSDEGDHGACCQVCGDGIATVQDPNEHQPADTAHESLRELVGMQVQLVFPKGHKCNGCDNYTSCNRNWRKLELVGGYFLCLAPLPNSIVTE